MVKKYILCFLWLYLVVDASIFCPYLKYPSSDADFSKNLFSTIMNWKYRENIHIFYHFGILGKVSIQLKERAEQESMYRISDDENDQGFTSKSESFRLITSTDNSECPVRSCLTELSAAEPKHHGIFQCLVIEHFRFCPIPYEYFGQSHSAWISSNGRIPTCVLCYFRRRLRRIDSNLSALSRNVRRNL